MESPNLPTYSAVDPARLSIGPLAQSPSLISGPASPSILTAVLPPPSPRLEHDASLAFDVPQEKEKLDVQDDAPGKRPSDDSAGATPLLYIMVTILLSAALTMLNKYIFTALHFPYPLFILCLHFGSVAIAARLLIASSNVTLPFRDWGSWTRHILPVGMLYAASIVFSNLAYLSLTVPFVQMLKAFNPIILVAVTACVERQAPPLSTILAVGTIGGGVFFAVAGEGKFIMAGFVCQMIGSLCEVGRLIATQRLLKIHRIEPLVLLGLLAPICFVFSVVLSILKEGQTPMLVVVERVGFTILVVDIGLAFLLNLVVLFLVSKTTALVLSLSGVIKDIILICAAARVFGDEVSSQQVAGYGIATFGMFLYRFGSGGRPQTISKQLAGAGQGQARGLRTSRLFVGCLALACLFIAGSANLPVLAEERAAVMQAPIRQWVSSRVISAVGSMMAASSGSPALPALPPQYVSWERRHRQRLAIAAQLNAANSTFSITLGTGLAHEYTRSVKADFAQYSEPCPVTCIRRGSVRPTDDAIWWHYPDAGHTDTGRTVRPWSAIQATKRGTRRTADQPWILYGIESSIYNPAIKDAAFRGHFDISSTYELDSDAPSPYLRPEDQGELFGIRGRTEAVLLHDLRRRLPRIAFLQSNCAAPSGRTKFVQELMAFVPVDAMGACLHNAELPEGLPGLDSLDFRHAERTGAHAVFSQYQFVMAFENSLTHDYVTEKLYEPLQAGAIPIYMGAKNVREMAPEGSYIDARSFATPELLAQHLNDLIKHPEKQLRYLRWRLEPNSAPWTPATMETIWNIGRSGDRQCHVCLAVAEYHYQRGTFDAQLQAPPEPRMLEPSDGQEDPDM